MSFPMNPFRYFSEDRILLSILFPVLAVGLLISGLSIYLLAPPLVSTLTDTTDSSLKLASGLGLSLCDDRFSDLLDLRLEDDPDTVSAFRKETIEQVKSIGRRFHNIQMAVVDSHGEVLGSSKPIPVSRIPLPEIIKGRGRITKGQWGKLNVLMSSRYFPFWQWRVVSFMPEAEYNKPILFAKRIVYMGTFGVLGAVLLSLLLAFNWLVNIPLGKLILATKSVKEGRFDRLRSRRKDEIGKLAQAFDSMVESLDENRRRIRSIMSDLKESEEQYRLVTENSLAAIAVIKKGKVIFANRRCFEDSGYGPDEFIRMDIADLFYSEDRPRIRRKLEALENGLFSKDHFEAPYLTKSGEGGWVEVLMVPITHKGEKVILIHGIDVTERKSSQLEKEKLEARLMQAQKMEAVGTLAGGIAHDFNNLLQTVQGHAELILLSKKDDDSLQKPLEAILHSAQRGRQLSRQLLTFSRRVETSMGRIHLNEQIKQVKELLVHTIPKMIGIELDLDEDLNAIRADSTQIEQLLVNLAVNAKDAMPDGGTLRIETRNVAIGEDRVLQRSEIAPGEYVMLKVSDTGAGISESDLEHVYEPFFTTKELGKGTGLGLAIVYGIVTDHRGAISCESKTGEGTSFTILFPVADRSQPEEEALEQEEIPGGTETILLVDDELLIRDLGVTMLATFGYDVLTAANGQEALETYKSRMDDIHLIILDLVMPEMGGAQCLERITELNPHARVLVASGHVPVESGFQESVGSARGFVSKPYEVGAILKAIRKALDAS
jgi:PAS domain S-box-containing protein